MLARAMFILRKQQYNEMCAGGDQLGALAFLRESVATVVPKEDMGQFNSLAMRLFDEKGVKGVRGVRGVRGRENRKGRGRGGEGRGTSWYGVKGVVSD